MTGAAALHSMVVETGSDRQRRVDYAFNQKKMHHSGLRLWFGTLLS